MYGGEAGAGFGEREWSKYSCGLAMVVFQHPSQSLSASHKAVAALDRLVAGWKQDHVALALVISLSMEMLHVLTKGTLQRRFSKQNQLRQTLLFHRRPPTFRESVQIGTAYRQFQRFHTSNLHHTAKRLAELGVAIVQKIST